MSARDALATIRARSTSPWSVADIGEMRTGDVPALVEIAETLEGYVAALDEGEPMNADDVDTLRRMLTALEHR